jgi:tetratricopeptide (TPR) repeat protein
MRLELLPELGAALTVVGELAKANSVLDEAIDAAKASGIETVEWRAVIEQAVLRLSTDPERTRSSRIRQEAEQAIAVFAELGDQRGLARAWRLLADIYRVQGQLAANVEALEHAIRHAQKAADRRQEAACVSMLAAAMFFGPTPVEDGIARCRELLEEAAGNRVVEAATLGTLGGLHAMRGEFEEARRLVRAASDIAEDLGITFAPPATTLWTAPVEMLAGEHAAAESALRARYELLTRIGEKGHLSSTAANLAHALCAQDRYEEAEPFTVISEELAGADDIPAQIVWRGARAKVLAWRGETEQAEDLARHAVELAATTDLLDMHGDALADLACVVSCRDNVKEAESVLRQALQLYEQKGNVVSASRVRTLLGEASRAGSRA